LQKQPTASKPKIFDVYAIKSVDDLYTNGIFDLDQFFQGLERMAGIKKFCQLKMAPSEKIFEIISINTRIFKNMGNKTLMNVENTKQ